MVNNFLVQIRGRQNDIRNLKHHQETNINVPKMGKGNKILK
jgi:hypothetical protein